MIKIQTIQPFVTYTSKKFVGVWDFSNSVNAAREKIQSKIILSEMHDRNDRNRNGGK